MAVDFPNGFRKSRKPMGNSEANLIVCGVVDEEEEGKAMWTSRLWFCRSMDEKRPTTGTFLICTVSQPEGEEPSEEPSEGRVGLDSPRDK